VGKKNECVNAAKEGIYVVCTVPGWQHQLAVNKKNLPQ